MDTAQHLTGISDAGYWASELSKRIGRLDLGCTDRGYVYCSIESSQRSLQLQARRIIDSGGLPALPH